MRQDMWRQELRSSCLDHTCASSESCKPRHNRWRTSLVQSLYLGWGPSKHSLHSRRRDAMPFGDLTDTLALTAVALDCGVVQDQRISTDVLAFEPGAPHAGAHPLDN